MTSSNKDNSKTVLVAPLDWGLGHATRCIPLIKELQLNKIHVILAASGQVAALLAKEFPELEILPLDSFSVKYPSGRKWFLLKILWQLPAAINSIYKERAWLKQAIKKNSIDAVISDNRMGLYSTMIPCVYITHQLLIKTGKVKWMDKWAQKIHYRFINRFNECWVPDFEQKEVSLAGELSHPLKTPAAPVKYIGALSRFDSSSSIDNKYDFLILLSGPEPQRSIFEELLLKQVPTVDGKFLVVRGLPGDETVLPPVKNAVIVNHLSSSALNEAIVNSNFIISRSGYTTVMDLYKLYKKSILVPTPGQPEQEYLASYLLENNITYTATQENFNLKYHIQKAKEFNYAFSTGNSPMENYKFYIKEFISFLYN